MFTKPKNIVSEKEHGFTLIELIVVIIIVGVLAAVGMTQYSTIVEKSRLAEAKIRLGTMRDLAYQYYTENGTLTGMQDADVGAGGGCTSTAFFNYTSGWMGPPSTDVQLVATRCTSGGKTPNYNSTPYYIMGLHFYPATGVSCWSCWYQGTANACFGYPSSC